MLKGPPGFEHLPQLPHLVGADVRRRKGRPVPGGVRRTARLVAEALFSPDGEPPDAERLDWVEADFADFYARAHGNAGLILRLSLFALMWLAPLFVGRLGPLSTLPIRRRVVALERFESSPLAPAALAVKAMLCILWFEHPRTRVETDSEATCLGRPAPGGLS